MLELWATLNGVPLGTGPIFTALAADIVMTELGQFSESSITLPAADQRVVLALQPYTLIEIVQPGLGTIGWGYVLNPEQQITAQDEHTITLTLAPLTVELTWRMTRRGWVAANFIGTILTRLVALVPGWNTTFTGITPTGGDMPVSVTINNATVLAGILQVGQQFACYVRQGADQYGAPTRTIEMGQFGAAPAVWLVSADGGDPDALHANNLIRLVATVDRQPNDVRDLVNVTVPFGGGANDTLVTLERLWRIVNDPTYPNAGRYGTDADSIARTGLPSVFPEYDPAYPISDPLNPPTGQLQWLFTDVNGNPVAGSYAAIFGPKQPDGTVPVAVFDSLGHLRTDVLAEFVQGQFNTRAVTLDGHFDYVVYDTASYAAYGHREGALIDSSLTYADNSVANQEMTERALYVECVTNFKKYGHPHHTFTCTADGWGRPTRAGDLIALDYQRISVGDSGAVVEMNVTDTLRVMKVVRRFNGDDVPVDTYTLSNLGRFDQDDTTAAAAQARTMLALQMNRGTSLAPLTISDRGNVDALHPLVKHVSIPKTLFRWQRCNLRVDFLPYTATSTTAQNPNGTPVVSADVEVLLPTPNALNAQAAAIAAMPKHVHRVPVTGGGINLNIPSVPYNQPPDRYLTVLGDGTDNMRLSANGNHYGNLTTGTDMVQVDLTPTSHPHPVAAAGDTVAHIPAGQRLANLPQHTHPVDQRIPDGPLPASCLVDINGQYLSSGLTLLSGTRDTSGAFTGTFEVDDISPLLNNITGDVTITLHPGTSGSNPYGVGMFVLSATWFGEFGGLTSTVLAQ